MGKQEYKKSDRVRYGELPKSERKAINKVADKTLGDAFDNTHICTEEISTMLECFEKNEYDTQRCEAQIASMYGCVDKHQYDPDPKALAAKWQNQMKTSVFRHFAQMKVLSRLAR